MALGAATTLAASKSSKPRLLPALNLGALGPPVRGARRSGLVPRPGQPRGPNSDQPRTYPPNKTTALCVNTVFARPYHSAPVLFPRKKRAGPSPALFGMGQAAAHGVIFPRLAGDTCRPGFLASFFLHIPIGVTRIRARKAADGLSGGDIAKAAACTVAFALAAVAGPNLAGPDRNSPDAFTREQIGPHDAEPV